MKLRQVKAVAALVTVGALALSGCSSDAGDGPGGFGGELTLAAVQDISSWDPSQAHFGHHSQYYQSVYDSLIRRTENDELVPMLATDWRYNDDRTELTLSIRDDVTFSDGAGLDAEVVKMNLDRFTSENGPDSAFLRYVTNIDAPDETTVVLDLSEPDPNLIYSLSNSSSFIASPTAIEGGDLAIDPVGSGPYVLDLARSVPGSEYVLNAREGYWDPELQKFDSVVIKPLTDSTALVNALVSGEVDAGLVNNPKAAGRVASAGLTEHEYTVDWNGILLFDRAGELTPALREVEVRQAINYAIDSESLLAHVLEGKGEVTSQILAPGVPGYDEALDEAYPYDQDKARKLMADAGYADGFQLTLPTVQGSGDPALAAALKQNLADIGVDLVWENVAITDYVASITTGKYAAVWFKLLQGNALSTSTLAVAPDAVYNPFHTTEPEVAEYIEKLQFGSTAEQDRAAGDFNKYLVEQAWFAPSYRPVNQYFSAAGIDVVPQPLQTVPSIYNFAPAS